MLFRSSGERRHVFFFSSRRRHTRSLCDWSSDVCSSDLTLGRLFTGSVLLPKDAPWLEEFVAELLSFPGRHDDQVDALAQGLAWRREAWKGQIGRASCRERV